MGMKINRRDLLIASGLSLLAGSRAPGRGAAPPRAQSQTPRTPAARFLEALQGNRLPLTMSEGPAGRGWDWLVQEARDARFTLIGEEHGVAETAQLSAALFNALRGSLAIGAAASAWDSSQRRAQWNRNNLAARLREESGHGSPPKVMLKFGYNHMIRGANYVNIFDLGAMTDEVAALS